MGGETPELGLEQAPQDASTKKLSECLKRIGDELDSNMELQRCGPWNPGVQPVSPFSLRTQESQLPTPTFPGSLESRPTAPFSVRPRGPGPHHSTQHSGLPALPCPRILKLSFRESFSPVSSMSTSWLSPMMASWLRPQFPYLWYGVDTRVSTLHLILPPQHWLSSLLQDDRGRGHRLPPRGLFPSGGRNVF